MDVSSGGMESLKAQQDPWGLQILWTEQNVRVAATGPGRDPRLGTKTSRLPAGYGRGELTQTVSKLCRQGHVREAVEALGVLVQTDCCIVRSLVYAVLKKCVVTKDLVLGRRIHALMVRMGCESDTFLCNHILRMYAAHGRLQDAMNVFNEVANPDAFLWSSIISAHVKHGQAKKAVVLYQGMRRSGVKPDGHLFVAALQACARGSDLESGQQVHADMLASGVEMDVFVCNSLVDMYAKCGSLQDARRVFDGSSGKDVVTWNAMIAGYSQQGMGQEALCLYSAMLNEGLAAPDSVTFVCLLQACANLGSSALEKGKQLHEEIRERGREAHVFVANSLVNMYAKCGSVEEARRVFDGLGEKDAVTWNAMIAGYAQHGMAQEALLVYCAMREEGTAEPNSVTFVSLLQACAGAGAPALEMGKELHGQIRMRGLQGDVFVASSLVNMYAKCGSLEDAQQVFDGLDQKDVVTWTALIAGYCQKGRGLEALHLYSVMEEEDNAAPNSLTFACLLQACAIVGTPALQKGKLLHAQIQDRGHQADIFLANSLVHMYAKCGSLEDAQRVFAGLHKEDSAMWNAMIEGISEQGTGEEALSLYSAVLDEGIAAPDSVTFVCLLQVCASLGTSALEKGKQLHAQIRDRGQEADVFIASSLVNMYAKCGSLENAKIVFDGLGQEKNVVTWNAMIAGYSQQGMCQEALSVYSAMQEEGRTGPDSVTFMCLLQACARVGTSALEKGTHLHAQIREQGLQDDVFVATSLVSMYAKCGSLENARRLFDELGSKSVVTWTALIAGYAQQDLGQKSLDLYSAMQEEGISPNSVTFVCLLQACASVGTAALEKGKDLHIQIREQGYEADVSVANSLVNMYAKCGSTQDAERLFEGLGEKDVVTWTALITGYAEQGMGQQALRLYSVMREESIALPNSVTYVCLLQACASMGAPALETGKQLHVHIREQGYQCDVVVANSLVNMYAKCGCLEGAQRLFDGLIQKDIVTWNALIAGYSQQGMGQEALYVYLDMQKDAIHVPNASTFVCLLQACANVAALHLGRQLHTQIEQQGLQADAIVAGSLINMYGKSGSMLDAQKVFDALPERDDVAWSALIAGYSCQGDSDAVFDLVERMRRDGKQPRSITFLSVLAVCSHAGLVNKGREVFEDMSKIYGITPTAEHYTCMVDLLGRAGELDEALALVKTMPVPPNASIWYSLLSASRKWSKLEVGRHAFEETMKLDKQDTSAYVLMSNIYTGAQMWEQAHDTQAERLDMRAWKQPGQSWWTDMDGLVHSFSVAD